MRILVLADIHIGSIKDIPYVYNTLTDIIEKEVTFKHTDLVVIAGDYFHRLFKVNEEYVSLAINVMSYLVRACSREKTKIRIVYGTESHEMNQYKLFNYHMTSKLVDMKVIDTVSEEVIDKKKILYVPEEYIDDKYEHYKEFLYSGKKYDYIFGHGVIEEGMPNIISYSNESNKNDEKFVPRFKSKEFSEISKITCFGHQHTMTDMGGNVYYIGSLFRNSFGEETPKGYGIIEDDKFHFVENKNAYVYKTYEFLPSAGIYDSADDIIKVIEDIKSENRELFNGNKTGRIRLVFRTAEGLDPVFKENLKTVLSNDDRFISMIKEPNIPVGNTPVIQEDEDDNHEYDFIIDPSMKIVDKMYQYICKQYEEPPMTYEALANYLSKILGNFNTEYDQITDDTQIAEVVKTIQSDVAPIAE